MKLYDISQELFSCNVYPGDPVPQKQLLSSTDNGDLYNLTAFSMCAHNGTHVDAPFHFLQNGKTVDSLPLAKTVGCAFVVFHDGALYKDGAKQILHQAKQNGPEYAERILIGGNVIVTAEAARVFADAGIHLLGNESQTVGPADAPMEVHKILLSAETVLLEGIRLAHVPAGACFLCAAPLLLEGADGSPCRAFIIK